MLLRHPLQFVCGWKGKVEIGCFPLHSHPHMELVYHPRGRGVTTLGNGEQIAFEPLGTVIYPAWIEHDERVSEPGEDVCLHVEWPAEAGGIMEESALYIPPVYVGERKREPFVHAEFLHLAQIRSDSARCVELNLRATALMARLLQFARPFKESSPPASAEIYVKTARQYIRENHAKISSIQEIARHVGVSEDYLRHLFLDRGSPSPTQFLIQERISRVKELLIHSSLPIKEIASLSGFQNERYLSTRFKKMTGLTPGVFRRRRNGRRENV